MSVESERFWASVNEGAAEVLAGLRAENQRLREALQQIADNPSHSFDAASIARAALCGGDSEQ